MSAILCFAFDYCAPMVDGNVERIISSAFMESLQTKLSNKVAHHIIPHIIPQREYKKFYLSLLDLGAIICVPKNPKCNECLLALICVLEVYKYPSPDRVFSFEPQTS